jgi:WD40 repeat protein
MSLPRWFLGVAFSLLFSGAVKADARPDCLLTSEEIQGPVDALVFWSCEQLVSLDREGQISTWDLKTGKIIGSLYAGKLDDRFFLLENRVALSPDGTLLFAGSGVWDLCSEKLVFKLRGDGGLAIGPSLIARGYFPGIWLHDLVTREDRTHIVGKNPWLRPLAFAADGKLLAMEAPKFEGGLIETRVLLYDIASREVRLRIPSQAFRVRAQFSRDNHMVAVGGYGTAIVCNTETGETLWRVGDGGYNALFAGGLAEKIDPQLTFSPDDRLLAIAAGSVVDVYEAATGELRCKLEAHKGVVSAIAFSPDGKSLASGSSDSKILLWNLRGHDAAARSLTSQELEVVWSDLARGSGQQVHHAIQRLVSSPEQAIKLFHKRLLPPKQITLDPDHIHKLIVDLGHEKFSVRNKAQMELESLGPSVAGALRQAQKKAVGLEISLRIERLLKESARAAVSPEALRKRRAIEVLELIGSPGATELLGQQTPGYARDRVAADARASLKRIRELRVPRKPKALKKETVTPRDGQPQPSPEVRPLPAGQRITASPALEHKDSAIPPRSRPAEAPGRLRFLGRHHPGANTNRRDSC